MSVASVTILGLGYIGLPTAAMLANAGYAVDGFDVDNGRLEALRAGNFGVEVEVCDLVNEAVTTGRLEFTERLRSTDAYLICVPTPTRNHRPDLSYVEAATASIVPVLQPGALIVLESTVPPGTVERVVAATLRSHGKNPDDYRLAHCPERVMPGSIVRELRNNARVIGGRRAGDAEVARELYASFVDGPIHVTDCLTAELVKVVENTYRDVNIAFANELALLCEELGADVWETIRLANEHPRVSILSPGPGVGGHCIPVDPHFLSNANPFVTELIQTGRRINERMPDVIVRRIQAHLRRPAHEATVTLLGAAYKANVDDTRESPTERIDELLRERGVATRIYDPIARSFSRPLAATLYDAVIGSDALVLLTEHDVFRDIDAAFVRSLMREPVLICGRLGLDVGAWRAAGFTVYVLGAGAKLETPLGELEAVSSEVRR
jgi:UDP-N-acetyl-D-mannosaminuronic acid dehydrogenase